MADNTAVGPREEEEEQRHHSRDNKLDHHASEGELLYASVEESVGDEKRRHKERHVDGKDGPLRHRGMAVPLD